MLCPKCKESDVVTIYTDEFSCDCGGTVRVDYCFCPICHYTFRLNNGKFLDEMEMTKALLDEVSNDLASLFDEDLYDIYDDMEINEAAASMSELINPCVKCGSLLTTYNEPLHEYECLDCGFKWEILEND